MEQRSTSLARGNVRNRAVPWSAQGTLILFFLVAFACCLLAQDTAAHRPMSTDRPDTTESPFTVPRGMFQIEASFADFSKDDRGAAAQRHQWIFGQINLKRGLTPNADLQIIFNTHSVAGQVEGGDRTYTKGFGDITVRLKRNLFGNDSGGDAVALMPYITFPTHTALSDRTWAGGLIIPFAKTLRNGWNVGLMSEIDLRERSEDGLGRVQYLHSATLGIPLTQVISSYTEMVSVACPTAPHQLSTNAGLTFQLTSSLVLDAGCRIGLSRSAPDLGVFSGFSIRF